MPRSTSACSIPTSTAPRLPPPASTKAVRGVPMPRQTIKTCGCYLLSRAPIAGISRGKGEPMTPRIPPLDPKSTLGPSREIFDNLQAKVGAVPNLYRVLGQSPAALDAYLALNEALARTKLEPKLREKVALAVSQRNGCGYCVAAH